MADNIEIAEPAVGVPRRIIKTDDVGLNEQVQYVKLDKGGNGVHQPVTDADPLPVELPGVATEAGQAAGNAALASLVAQTDTLEALLTSLNGAVATQTTLAALLAKVIAAPATEAKQDDEIAALASLVAQTDAVEASLASIDAKHPALVPTVPLDTALAVPVRQVSADMWRVSFSQVGAGLLEPELLQVRLGAGQAINQAGGNLTITTGVTANAETIIRSIRTFRGAHHLRYLLQLSQRIVNQHFEVALADLIGSDLAYTINSPTSVTVTFPAANPFTAVNVTQSVNLGALSGVGIPGRYAIASVAGLTVTFTVAGWPASGSGTLTLWGWNYHRVAYTGTSATTASYDAQRNGFASGDTAATINTTAAPGHVVHAQSVIGASALSDSSPVSAIGASFTARASRLAQIPDEARDLHVFLVVRNGNTAPASTTTLTLGFVGVELMGRNKMYLAGGDPNSGALAAAVQVLGGNLSVTGNINTVGGAGTALMGDVGLQARANATGAATSFKVQTGATTNAAIVKAAAGRVFGWRFTNTAAAARVVRFYNLATLAVVGTTVPLYNVVIPAGQTVGDMFDLGIAHAAGIGISVTAGLGDLDATVTAANDVIGTAWFA